MEYFTSLDLQQRSGEIQRAAIAGPVVITNHGRARMVMMTVEEFARLKKESGEALPPELHRKRTAVRHMPPADPLGYDTTDLNACALAMADAALSGKNRTFVDAEIARFENRLRSRR